MDAVSDRLPWQVSNGARAAADAAAVAVGDPEASRLVYAIVIALCLIGVLLVGVAIWLIRQTRTDPELLAPLELMSERRWNARNPADQRRMLDEVRPAGAVPERPERIRPDLDEDFDRGHRPVPSFDDLAAIAAEPYDAESFWAEVDPMLALGQVPARAGDSTRGTAADDPEATGTDPDEPADADAGSASDAAVGDESAVGDER